jgi:hypothetical protein
MDRLNRPGIGDRHAVEPLHEQLDDVRRQLESVEEQRYRLKQAGDDVPERSQADVTIKLPGQGVHTGFRVRNRSYPDPVDGGSMT